MPEVHQSPVHDHDADQYPIGEGGASFPITAEAVEQENYELLQATIFAPDEVKQRRYARFPQAWHKEWVKSQQNGGTGYFGVDPADSPFARYSSQGWKLHVPFQKGYEEDVSRFLYGAGLYFKTEAQSTFFNWEKESGSTIYIGSWDATQSVAEHLKALEPVLAEGAVATPMDDEHPTLHEGSGSDIETVSDPRITARFDIQKSTHGSIGGDRKYSSYGLPAWINNYGIMSALPILTTDEAQLNALEAETFQETSDSVFSSSVSFTDQGLQRLLRAFQEAQERAEQALIKDYGQEFVLGKNRS